MTSSVRWALAAIVALVPVAGRAVTPLSPRLDPASRLALVRALAKAGISEVGSSAVANSLLTVLGTAPEARQYHYREAYPQLPDVDADAVAGDTGCAETTLTVRSKASAGPPVVLRGVYCLVDSANLVWGARSLAVERK